MTTTLPDRGLIQDLRGRIAGDVIAPHDTGYAAAGRAWNLAYHHEPALIVLPRNAADVSAAIRAANHGGFGVAIQATGHGVARTALGSMLILMHYLDDVAIDAEAWTARIGGGAKWKRVLGPAQDAGLAPLLGSTPDVGAVGYTLGGGMGWLARKYGLNADHVRWLEVVTADGEIRRTCEDTEPDLYWALLGGGAGSLAIVTGMEVDLVPVTSVYAGNLMYPATYATEVAARYREWVRSVPDELTSSLVLMNFPPFDDVPESVRGRSFVIVRGCYAGPADVGAELLADWREWRAPELDLWGPMSFRDVASISNDPEDPLPGMSTSAWLQDIGDETLDILIPAVFPADGPPVLLATEIRHAGGAISRSSRPIAYGNRSEEYLLQMVGIAMDEAGADALARRLREVKDELGSHVSPGVYLNFLEGEEKVRRTADGFDAESFARLRSVKANYDPHDLFNHGLAL